MPRQVEMFRHSDGVERPWPEGLADLRALDVGRTMRSLRQVFPGEIVEVQAGSLSDPSMMTRLRTESEEEELFPDPALDQPNRSGGMGHGVRVEGHTSSTPITLEQHQADTLRMAIYPDGLIRALFQGRNMTIEQIEKARVVKQKMDTAKEAESYLQRMVRPDGRAFEIRRLRGGDCEIDLSNNLNSGEKFPLPEDFHSSIWIRLSAHVSAEKAKWEKAFKEI